MRRVFKEEEFARPFRRLDATSTTEVQLDEAAEETEERHEPVRVVRSKPPRSGKALRWLILVFGSIGIFSALVPMVSGLSLPELLQGANFKAAYSGTNMGFLRGMAAVKAGNLAAATDILLTLPPTSAEAADLAVVLSPRLLEAGDYSRAAQICQYLENSRNAQSVGPYTIGTHLAERRGLAGAYAFVTQDPSASLLRAKILPGIFTTVVAKELPALEKLTPTLTGEEKDSAVTNIVQAHSTAGHFDEAWRWSAQVSTKERNKQRISLLSNRLSSNLEDVVKHIGSLEPGKDTESLQNSLISFLSNKDHKLARKYAEKLPAGHVRDEALMALARSSSVGWDERLALARQLKSSTEKFNTLVGLAVNNSNVPKARESSLDALRPLAKKDPALAATHDALIRYLCVVARSATLAERMLDPKARSIVEKELSAGGPISAKVTWPGGSASTSR